MALSICMKCLKYLVFVINLLFWLAGMGVLVAAIYIRCYPDDIEKAIGATADESLHTVTYIFMGIGGVMTVLGFLGCCGAYQESACILATFITLLFVVLAGEIAGVVAAYMLKHDLEGKMEDEFRDVVEKRNMTDSKLKMFLWIQETLECCGSTEREDWLCNDDLNRDKIKTCECKRDLGIQPDCKVEDVVFKVPESCCRDNWRSSLKSTCGYPEKTAVDQWNTETYKTGCSKKVMNTLYENIEPIIGVIAGVIGFEILILIGTIILCCNLRHQMEDDGYMKP